MPGALGSKEPQRAWFERLPVLAGAPLCALLAVLLFRWGVDLPYWDEWALADLLVGSEPGLEPADFTRQHNEHRIPVPLAISYVVALLSDWNVRAEIWVNLAFAAATYGLALSAIRRGDRLRRSAAALLVGALVFSPMQLESWLSGWNLQLFVNATAATFAAWMLFARRVSIAGTVAAAIGVAAASFSYASGLLLWPLCAVQLALSRRRALHQIVWAAAAFLTFGAFFRGYDFGSRSFPSSLAAFGDVVSYAAAFLGAPLGAWTGRWEICAVAGATGIAAALLRAKTLFSEPSRAGGLLVLYGVTSALLVAAGRSHLGLDAALTSRYQTIGSLFWVGLLATTVQALGRGSHRVKATASWGEDVRRIGRIVFALVLVVALSGTWLLGARKLEEQHRGRSEIRGALTAGFLVVEHLPLVFPHEADLRGKLEALCRKRLWAFRDRPADLEASCRFRGLAQWDPAPLLTSRWQLAHNRDTDADYVLVNGGFSMPIESRAEGEARLRRPCIRGWASGSSSSPAFLVLAPFETGVGAAALGEPRPRVAAALGARYISSGFTICPDPPWTEAPTRLVVLDRSMRASWLPVTAP